MGESRREGRHVKRLIKLLINERKENLLVIKKKKRARVCIKERKRGRRSAPRNKTTGTKCDDDDIIVVVVRCCFLFSFFVFVDLNSIPLSFPRRFVARNAKLSGKWSQGERGECVCVCVCM